MEPGKEQGAGSWTLRVDASFHGLRADAYLFHELPTVSRTRVRQKIQAGEALLNGHRFSTATRLRAGDEVRVWWRNEPQTAEPAALAVLFEDEHLLAVDKPAGVASHPMGGRQTGTIIQSARERYRSRIREDLERGLLSFYPTLVNRLDVSTSGIVLIALTRGIHRLMQAMTAARLIGKEYVAFVEGVVRADEGIIDLPIGPSPDSVVELKMACRPDGKESRTRYEVVERFRAHTLLRVVPLTGRQHQIRVHLAAIGHPVVGDLLYKDESLFRPGYAGRHCLHARRMTFSHPVTGKTVSIEAPVPRDFEATVQDMTAEGTGA